MNQAKRDREPLRKNGLNGFYIECDPETLRTQPLIFAKSEYVLRSLELAFPHFGWLLPPPALQPIFSPCYNIILDALMQHHKESVIPRHFHY